MTSPRHRESQTTLQPESLGRSRSPSYQNINHQASLHFDHNGHSTSERSNSDRIALGNGEQRLLRPFSVDTLRTDQPRSQEFKKLEEGGLDETSNRASTDGLPRTPERSYCRNHGRRPDSSLWIRDSRGRQILEIGLNEGQYVAGLPHEEDKEQGRSPSRSEEAADKKGDEEKGKDGPPKPVGFWDKGLSKTRLNAYRRWLMMSMPL